VVVTFRNIMMPVPSIFRDSNHIHKSTTVFVLRTKA
jgi:hypothetical protein